MRKKLSTCPMILEAKAYKTSLSSRFEKLNLYDGILSPVQATYSGSIHILKSQPASPGVNKNGWCCSISFIELFTWHLELRSKHKIWRPCLIFFYSGRCRVEFVTILKLAKRLFHARAKASVKAKHASWKNGPCPIDRNGISSNAGQCVEKSTHRLAQRLFVERRASVNCF